uniref:DUF4220 domain-containing protein n=1 Tax=Fagus sylvatica TaxID=28930 RepID=A0A2N9J2P0_FAGSY
MRKKTANKLVITTIWSAYLLADWAASFSVGLVFDSEEKYTTSDSGPVNGNTMDDTGLLLVLWAPFLLILVGGQDRLTSFAIEDNELWLRHLIWLILQVCTTGFVFIQSLHQNRLWFPTFLLILAGAIKYAERTIALYLASSDCLGISVLREPDPGPNYERLMRTYSHYRENNLPIKMEYVEDKEAQANKYYRVDITDKLNCHDMVEHAYHFADKYKGIIVNLMFSSIDHKESREVFSTLEAKETLGILEIELNYFYDLLHTKVVVANSKLGKITRVIPFGLVVASLSLFYKEEKQGFKGFDVKVTYTMFFGVLGLDMLAHFLWMFSDSSVASLNKKPKKYSRLSEIRSKILNKFIDLKKPKWGEIVVFQKQMLWTSIRCKNLEAMTSINWKQKGRTTPIIFKRWSETLSQLNFIYYCHTESSKSKTTFRNNQFFTFFFDKVYDLLKYLHVKDFIDQKKNDIIQMNYVFPLPLTDDLWEFIFTQLKEKSFFADDPEEAKRISSARGDWILENGNFDYSSISSLMHYVKNVAYDESLLLWHIATELCCQKDIESHQDDPNKDHDDHNKDRDRSKILSDYMLYLLYQQPGMMSEVSGIAKLRFRDTWVEAKRLFESNEGKNLRLACTSILEVDTCVKPVHVKGDQSKSLLFDACILAKEIENLGPMKWKVTSEVWVELLSYAANRSRANAHVQLLSKGGELLTFVWLLMAHFGLKEHAWIQTRTRANLILNK